MEVQAGSHSSTDQDRWGGVRWRVSLASQPVIRPPTQARWCVLLLLFGHSPFALEENMRNLQNAAIPHF